MKRTLLGFIAGLVTGASLVCLTISNPGRSLPAAPVVADRTQPGAQAATTMGSLPFMPSRAEWRELEQLAASDPFGALEHIMALEMTASRPPWARLQPATTDSDADIRHLIESIPTANLELPSVVADGN